MGQIAHGAPDDRVVGRVRLPGVGGASEDLERARNLLCSRTSTALSDHRAEPIMGYSPARMELRFGTSGLRGRVVDMTDFEVHVNTLGFLSYLAERGEIGAGQVALAEDLRESSAQIGRAAARAIRDAGRQPLHLGKIPTPALAYCALRRSLPCIMITGSHIPADRNGVKFYRPTGEVLKSDEPGILAAVAKARQEKRSVFAEEKSEPISRDGEAQYVARYLDLFPAPPLQGRRIVVYQHSAVGRDLVVHILEGLGAEVIPEERSDRFVAVDTEDVSVEDEHRYGEMVAKHRADALVSTDGDGDRPLIVDEAGRFHRGDVVGAVVARWLRADFAAVPISTSDAIDEYLGASAHLLKMVVEGLGLDSDDLDPFEGLELVRTRIGSPYVIEAMMEARSRGKSAVVGWEANGGFLTASDFSIGDAVLSALPTRDAMLPIVGVLAASAKKRMKLSKLFGELPQRATRAGLLDDFPVEVSKSIVARLEKEGRDLIGKYFTRELGFEPVKSVNGLDGLRIYFENGDIAHLRPSGNAPQFRIYAVADTQKRADEIVDRAVEEPDGILRRLERELS
jgi:phosphomannomutase